MDSTTTLTAFIGASRLASGDPGTVARAVAAARAGGRDETVLVFSDETGAQVDLDLRPGAGPASKPAEPAEEGPRKAGRPRLGVTAREVTLLPRHWDWLNAQPGGASVTLRKLVEAARKADAGHGPARRAREAADRFMTAMLGNAPHYEEASRALWRGDGALFLDLTAGWPADLRDHVRRLSGPAFAATAEPAPG